MLGDVICFFAVHILAAQLIGSSLLAALYTLTQVKSDKPNSPLYLGICLLLGIPAGKLALFLLLVTGFIDKTNVFYSCP